MKPSPLTFLPFLLITTLLFFGTATPLAQAGTGTVAESIDAGGYSYIKLEDPDMWIATSTLSISVGDQIQFGEGTEMRSFHSKSLDRTFDSIFFIQDVSAMGGRANNKPVDSGEKIHPTIANTSSVPVPAAGDIPQLADGKTIAAMFDQAAELEGQSVSLSARVMKVSRNILGKNWITLQDGTGIEPDNKIMATSTELVVPGDLVVVNGTLVKDVDIGAGYNYKVLIEQAAFSVNSDTVN